MGSDDLTRFIVSGLNVVNCLVAWKKTYIHIKDAHQFLGLQTWQQHSFTYRFRMVSPRVPGSSFMVTRWLRSSKIPLFQIQAQWGKAIIFFSHNLLGFTLIEQARSSAHFWISSSGQKHGLLWWARNASCAPYLKQRFSSRPHDLRKEVIYFPSEYWEMENRFLKASKPKSSYLLSYIKGGAFCTSHLTLLYILCLVYLHQYKVMGSYLVP